MKKTIFAVPCGKQKIWDYYSYCCPTIAKRVIGKVGISNSFCSLSLKLTTSSFSASLLLNFILYTLIPHYIEVLKFIDYF